MKIEDFLNEVRNAESNMVTRYEYSGEGFEDSDGINHECGWVWNTVQGDGFSVLFEAEFHHEAGKPSTAIINDVDGHYELNLDFDVIDNEFDDNCVMDIDDIIYLIDSHCHVDDTDKMLNVLPDDLVEYYDNCGKNEPESDEVFVLTRTNDIDLKFKGKLIANAISDRFNGRWMELKLYQTKKGSYVCQRLELTNWEGETDRSKVVVLDDIGDVISFFGFGYLSKELYEKANIPCVEEVE